MQASQPARNPQPDSRPTTGGAKPRRKPQRVARSAPRAPVAPPAADDEEETGRTGGGFLVGVGASAGGLQALTTFFASLQPQPSLAFVVISHQRAGRTSLLTSLIARATTLPVHEIVDGMALECGAVHVAPPGYSVSILDSSLHLRELPPGSLNLPIDSFFRSLASDRREQAVGIVLSGTGSDGTLGLAAIRGEGGFTLAQAPASAQYDGMPQSAIRADVVDVILPPQELAMQVMQLAAGKPARPVAPADLDGILPKLCVLLRGHTGHDFSCYKIGTIRRRVERRMSLQGISSFKDYLRHAQKTSSELDALYRDLLIGVTRFFRDPEAFEAITAELSTLLAGKSAGQEIRVWVPGCATGEEAYSLAIVLAEIMASQGVTHDVQCFGTDLDQRAIDVARVGVYAEGIAADVGSERLQRFFTTVDGHHKVNKEIRKMVVFAPQDVISDPPFTRLDLISCRNLLIYLNADPQKKLLPLFHFALKPGGLLFLGTSETIGSEEGLFSTISAKNRVYKRGPGGPVAHVRFPRARTRKSHDEQPLAAQPLRPSPVQAAREVLLQSLAPSVILDARGEVSFVHGHTGHCLEPAQGQATVNAFDMAREGLRGPLTKAVRQAGTQRDRSERRRFAYAPTEIIARSR